MLAFEFHTPVVFASECLVRALHAIAIAIRDDALGGRGCLRAEVAAQMGEGAALEMHTCRKRFRKMRDRAEWIASVLNVRWADWMSGDEASSPFLQ